MEYVCTTNLACRREGRSTLRAGVASKVDIRVTGAVGNDTGANERIERPVALLAGIGICSRIQIEEWVEPRVA